MKNAGIRRYKTLRLLLPVAYPGNQTLSRKKLSINSNQFKSISFLGESGTQGTSCYPPGNTVILYIINSLELYPYSPEIMFSLFQALILLAMLNYSRNYVCTVKLFLIIYSFRNYFVS